MVWVDQSALQYGREFPKQIEDAIKHCDIFLLLWSSDASRSEWVARELHLAKEFDRGIIPVLLDGEPLPPQISELHGFSSFVGAEFRRFFSIPEPPTKLISRLLRGLPRWVLNSGRRRCRP